VENYFHAFLAFGVIPSTAAAVNHMMSRTPLSFLMSSLSCRVSVTYYPDSLSRAWHYHQRLMGPSLLDYISCFRGDTDKLVPVAILLALQNDRSDLYLLRWVEQWVIKGI